MMRKLILERVLKTNTHRHIGLIAFHPTCKRLPTARCYSSDDSGNSKNQKGSKEKLNDLLKSMVQDTQHRKARGDTPVIDYKLAVQKRGNPNKKEKVKVAEVIDDKAAPESKVPVTPEPPKEPELSRQILSAVKSVAASLEGDPEVTENELVQKLKTQQAEKINLSELFLGMKIDRTKKPVAGRAAGDFEGSRAQRVRQMLGDDTQDQLQRQQGDRYAKPDLAMRRTPSYVYNPINLFGSRPIGIFTGSKKLRPPPPETPTLSTWDRIHQKELKLAATHPPANGFEEMILWTEQGKFWHFPIDNEQGNEENSKYDFTDHVFLEPVIDSWCPKKGPIRQFMELVTVSLSKNPYLSVPEKHEYLGWYHEYFKGKAEIIKQVGAGEIK